MNKNKLLIVDDEVGIRELLSEILQDEGYRVALAENAGEARAYRQRQQPALVLLDIWMPDTDGVTLLREWAANGQLTMPVVMMSGVVTRTKLAASIPVASKTTAWLASPKMTGKPSSLACMTRR